jgi:predicted DNA-binding transcriptional regulator YafY
MPMILKDSVIIDYTNHRGERALRSIRPIRIAWESSEWHPETQWILHALDTEKNELREFAMADVHSWNGVRKPPAGEPRAD